MGREAGGRARSESAKALYRKLTPKPSRPAHEVAADQRARLHGAMVEGVAAHGFAAVTVRELCALAGVSSRSFYERFPSKEACLISAYELILGSASERALVAMGSGTGRCERLELFFRSAAEGVAADPKGSQLVLFDILDGGAEALRAARRGTMQVGAGLATALEPQADAAPQPAPPAVRAILAGRVQVVRSRLLDGRSDELPTLSASLAEWACAQLGAPAGSLSPLLAAENGSRAERGAPPRRTVPGEPDAECELLLGSCVRLAAERGPASLTPACIAARAGLSCRAFSRHFESVGQCFLAAYEALCATALAEALAAARGAESWPECAASAVASLSERTARDPIMARVVFASRASAGSALIRAETRLLAAFARALHRRAPGQSGASLLAIEAGLGAVWAALAHEVAHGPCQSLPARLPFPCGRLA